MTPDQYTNQEFYLDVGDGHQLYVQDWGNPKGLPIMYMNYGPGSGLSDKQKRAFDPDKHHVAFFDQRGCGKSLPYGKLEHNTTADTIGDTTKIADHLGWKQFVLYGTSWGTFLALTYAIHNPARVKALVLGSIFTGSTEEIDWIERGHFRSFFPEVWEKYLERTPKSHHDNPTAYHYKNILGDEEQLIHSSALAVAEMEYSILFMDDNLPPLDPETFDPTGTRIFAHYLNNKAFVPDGFILDNAHKLTMPVRIVHGRFDMECPPIAAYKLSKKLPNGRLTWAISSHYSEHENRQLLKTFLLEFSEKG